LPNGVAFKRTPKGFRYQQLDLLFIKFTYTKTEQTNSSRTTNITTDYSVPLETLDISKKEIDYFQQPFWR